MTMKSMLGPPFEACDKQAARIAVLSGATAFLSCMVRLHRASMALQERRSPNLATERARAFAASTSRLRGSADVVSAAISVRAVAATSSTARSNAASLLLDGILKPLSFLTNCSDASRISISVAGGSKLNRVLMLRHMGEASRRWLGEITGHRIQQSLERLGDMLVQIALITNHTPATEAPDYLAIGWRKAVSGRRVPINCGIDPAKARSPLDLLMMLGLNPNQSGVR